MFGTARLLPLLLLLTLTGSALAVRSGWSDLGEAQLRLLALPVADGRVTAGIEIALEPGWHTYWRYPGDTGVPPHFDFSGSQNVANVEVRFPAPERLDTGEGVSLVYKDGVVLPVTVTARHGALPVILRLKAEIGLCRDICIPTTVETALEIPSSGADVLTKAVLARSESRVPGAPEPGRFAIESVAAAAEGDALLVAVRMPESAHADLVVEAPDGLSAAQPEFVSREGTLSRYKVALTGRPEGDREKGGAFRFIAISGSQSIEAVVRAP